MWIEAKYHNSNVTKSNIAVDLVSYTKHETIGAMHTFLIIFELSVRCEVSMSNKDISYSFVVVKAM